MKNSRIDRIIIGTVLPCFLGSFIFTISVYIQNLTYHHNLTVAYSFLSAIEMIGMLFILPMFSFLFIGTQSFVYSLIMEICISKKIDNIYIFVCISSLLGFAAGVSLSLIDFRVVNFPVVGLITGLIVGYILFGMRDR